MNITYQTLVEALQAAKTCPDDRTLAIYWEVSRDLKAQLSLLENPLGNPVLRPTINANVDALYEMLGIPVRWADDNSKELLHIIFDKPSRRDAKAAYESMDRCITFSSMLSTDERVDIRVSDVTGRVSIYAQSDSGERRLLIQLSPEAWERLRLLMDAANWRVSDFTIED